jgi:hypothetical protein
MDNAQLTIADLASLQGIIEAACSRGAFKASEMRQVGEIYEKLTNFLASISEKAETQIQASSEGEHHA